MLYYSDPLTELHLGDIRDIVKELRLASCDMVMTSPPFYGLRAYKIPDTIWDGDEQCGHRWHEGKEMQNGCRLCGAWRGCLGNEPTPDLYIKHLCDIFDLLKPVLKKTATIWVEIGDSYSGGHRKTDKRQTFANSDRDLPLQYRPSRDTDIPSKSLIGIPERFVLEMQRRGYVRRNTIIWWKRNCMPESVSDRFTEDFEYLSLFSLQGKYFFERQFEPMARLWNESNGGSWAHASRLDDLEKGAAGTHRGIGYPMPNPLGRNMRTVWDIPTATGMKGHYAQYPEKLCETPILAGCPLYVCPKCGKPRRKVYKTEGGSIGRSWHDHKNDLEMGMLQKTDIPDDYIVKEMGFSDCKCGAPFAPGIVLDPFVGTGTTLSVAKRLGRKSIGIELSEKYCKLAVRRIEGTQSPLA